MANDLSKVIPKLLAQGLVTLRENAIMPRLVNRRYEEQAGMKGSTVDVPIFSAIDAVDVVPGATAPAGQDVTPETVPIALNNWKESAFQMNDKEIQEAMEGVVSGQLSEAAKAIANAVDKSILALYKTVPNVSGTAGATPFATTIADFTDAMVHMDEELSPVDMRSVVLSPRAQGNAVKLPEFLRADHTGSQADATIIKGMIGEKIGSLWYMDQNLPTHTSGVPGGTPLTSAAHAAGVKAVALDGLAAAGTYKAGDVISFAGSTQTYAIAADVTAAAGVVLVQLTQPLRAAVADNAAVTLVASHKVNLHFHRDAFALASRPFKDLVIGGQSLVQSAIDPITGLVMRLEVVRQHKQTRWSFDCLWGVGAIRPYHAVRILG